MSFRLVRVSWYDPTKTGSYDIVRVEFEQLVEPQITLIQRVLAFLTSTALPQPEIIQHVAHGELYVFRAYPTGERLPLEVEDMVADWASQFKYIEKMNAAEAKKNERIKQRLRS